jgi:CopG family nickel-responsive transcriptional regulator
MVERITISLDEAVLAGLDGFMEQRGYTNRSEAIRDLLRQSLTARAGEALAGGHCLATVSFIYDFGERDLIVRLARMLHDHHDLAISSQRAVVDHHHSVETLIMNGPTERVRALCDAIVSERGVKFGQVNLVPVAHQGDAHRHHQHGHSHAHLTPLL